MGGQQSQDPSTQQVDSSTPTIQQIQKERSKSSTGMFCMSRNVCSSSGGSSGLGISRRVSKIQQKEWYYFLEQSFHNMTKDSKWTAILLDTLYEKVNQSACIKYQQQISTLYKTLHQQQSSEELRLLKVTQKSQSKTSNMKQNSPLLKKDHTLNNSYTEQQYKKFVLKNQNGQRITSVQELQQKIERATVKLRQDQWEILSSESQKDSVDVNLSDKVLGDVKKFIAIMLFAVLRFYIVSLDLDQQMKDLLQEEFMAKITKRILSGNVYKIALSICRYETMNLEKRFRAQLRRLNKSQISTQDLDISKYFLLNEQSQIRDIQQKLAQRKTYPERVYSINTDFEDIQDENDCNINDEDHYFNKPNVQDLHSTRSKTSSDSNNSNKSHSQPNYAINSSYRERKGTDSILQNINEEIKHLLHNTSKQVPSVEEIQQRLQGLPYQKAIQKIREVQDYENPLKKANIIDQAKSFISQCIDEFWKGLCIPSDKLMIDADQLVSIVTYSIIKSEVKDLPGQIKLIEEFTSVQVQNSKLGQALFTLKAATENIAHGIILRRMSSMNKLMRSFTRGSGPEDQALTRRTPKPQGFRIECQDASENVSEDAGTHSFTNRMVQFTKQITNKQPINRGMTIYSVIDPFLTELDDYGEEMEGYDSLFSEDEDFKQFEQLNKSSNII